MRMAIQRSAFPSAGWWPLAPMGVALITIAIWQAHRARPLRSGALPGFLAGAAFFTVQLFWPHVIGPDAWLVLMLVEALHFVAPGAGIAGRGATQARGTVGGATRGKTSRRQEA